MSSVYHSFHVAPQNRRAGLSFDTGLLHTQGLLHTHHKLWGKNHQNIVQKDINKKQ